MKKRIQLWNGVALPYYASGRAPRFLVDAGTHGDEAEVGVSVERFLRKHAPELPSFLWIPKVSPSAVKHGTRLNARGIDVNRHFSDGATDPEVRAVMAIINRYHFALHLSFHEDRNRRREFYLYDTDDAMRGADSLFSGLFTELLGIGIVPFNGYDAEQCASRVEIRNGYFSERWWGGGFTCPALMGQSTIYTVLKRIARRAITLEVPGEASQELKDKLAAVVIRLMFAKT